MPAKHHLTRNVPKHHEKELEMLNNTDARQKHLRIKLRERD
jgi:hypothetical protein